MPSRQSTRTFGGAAPPPHSDPPPRRGQDCYIGDCHIQGNPSGPLQGTTAVIKDSYDVEGHVTTNGSPAWASSHPLPSITAPAVTRLIDAGATVVGKTIMDELAYSLQGENYHYGTPVNPACPERIPGGSSSGAAVAVAAGDAELGLGGDTGGSVRVPASFCGIFGMRPSHGRVPTEGSCPLAPSFDTAGWFARDAGLLRRAGSVLLRRRKDDDVVDEDEDEDEDDVDAFDEQRGNSKRKIEKERGTLGFRWLVGVDGFALADEDASRALYDALSSRVDSVKDVLGGSPTEVHIAEEVHALHGGEEDEDAEGKGARWQEARDRSFESQSLNSLEAWREVFRVHQAYEVWAQHGAWLQETRPTLGPGVKERFDAASTITPKQFQTAAKRRRAIRARMDALLGGDGVLMVPTAAGPAPRKGAPADVMEAYRSRLLALTCVAGLSGLPEVTLPVARVDGCPVGLSLIGPRGKDEALLEVAERLAGVLGISSVGPY
jgi:amidase